MKGLQRASFDTYLISHGTNLKPCNWWRACLSMSGWSTPKIPDSRYGRGFPLSLGGRGICEEPNYHRTQWVILWSKNSSQRTTKTINSHGWMNNSFTIKKKQKSTYDFSYPNTFSTIFPMLVHSLVTECSIHCPKTWGSPTSTLISLNIFNRLFFFSGSSEL